MAVKKGKSGKGKPGKGSGKKPSPPGKEEVKDAAVLLNPAERVGAVRPMWEQKPHEERVNLLTVDVDTLKQQAKATAEKQRAHAAAEGAELVEYALEIPLEDVLAEGLRRLNTQDTWKIWQFNAQEFCDAESFRNHVTSSHIRAELLHLLPKDDPKVPERPAEAALRQRMTDLLSQVQMTGRQGQDDQVPATVGAGEQRSGRGRRGQKSAQEQASSLMRDTNVDAISVMLEALEKEHDHLYQSLLRPITTFVCDMLPEDVRETSHSELHYEDLEKLPSEEVARVAEWLTEKVDALSSRLKAEQREDEEEDEGDAMGDVDLFALTPDGNALTVNSKWLQHLEERLLGEDGHPRKAKPGEDPHRMGLVLEWVYGSIVSTAEKSRDGAKRCLGLRPPTTQQAYTNLINCLEDQLVWEQRAKQAKDLMNAMLQSRKEADELAKQYNISSTPDSSADAVPADDSANHLPDVVIMKMLKREVLLTTAKLHALSFDSLQAKKTLESLKSQIRHGEPELERLKRELEDLKHAPRGLEGTFRTAAEMERHRHQLADAAIEEQLEVQTAFREQGAKLQSLYDKKQRTDFELAKRETETKQLNGWKATVENLLERFEDLVKQTQFLQEIDEGQANIHSSRSSSLGFNTSLLGPAAAAAVAAADEAAAAIAAEEGAAGPLGASAVQARSSILTAQHTVQLNKLRQHFHKDVRKQLYGNADDKNFFDRIKMGLKSVENRLEDGRVALQHLELFLVNVACDDPGATIGSQLVLPLLQERLDAAALEYKADRAKLAEKEIIAMEMAAAEAKAAEEERRKQQLQKKKGKNKTDKEKAAAGKAAQEAAELERKQREQVERQQREEEERRKRQEALQLLRKHEEELMAARRQQLMAEDGYWAQRMAEEQQRAALAMTIGAVGADALAVSSSTTGDTSGSSSTAGAASRSGAPSEDGESSAAGGSSSAIVDEDGFIIMAPKGKHKRGSSQAGRERDANTNGSSNVQQRSGSRGRAYAAAPGAGSKGAGEPHQAFAFRRGSAPAMNGPVDGGDFSRTNRTTGVGRSYSGPGLGRGDTRERRDSRERRGAHADNQPPKAPPAVLAGITNTKDDTAAPVATGMQRLEKAMSAGAAAASGSDAAASQQWSQAVAQLAAAASRLAGMDASTAGSNMVADASVASAGAEQVQAPPAVLEAPAAAPAGQQQQQQQQQEFAASQVAPSTPAPAATTAAVQTAPSPAAGTSAQPQQLSIPAAAVPPVAAATPSKVGVEAPATPAPVVPNTTNQAPTTVVVVKQTAVVPAEPPAAVASITFGSLEDMLDDLESGSNSTDDATSTTAAGASAAAAAPQLPSTAAASESEQQQQQHGEAVQPQPAATAPGGVHQPAAVHPAALQGQATGATAHPAGMHGGLPHPGALHHHHHGHHMAGGHMRPPHPAAGMVPPPHPAAAMGGPMQPLMAAAAMPMMMAAAAARGHGAPVHMGPMGPLPPPAAVAAVHAAAAAAAAAGQQHGKQAPAGVGSVQAGSASAPAGAAAVQQGAPAAAAAAPGGARTAAPGVPPSAAAAGGMPHTATAAGPGGYYSPRPQGPGAMVQQPQAAAAVAAHDRDMKQQPHQQQHAGQVPSKQQQSSRPAGPGTSPQQASPAAAGAAPAGSANMRAGPPVPTAGPHPAFMGPFVPPGGFPPGTPMVPPHGAAGAPLVPPGMPGPGVVLPHPQMAGVGPHGPFLMYPAGPGAVPPGVMGAPGQQYMHMMGPMQAPHMGPPVHHMAAPTGATPAAATVAAPVQGPASAGQVPAVAATGQSVGAAANLQQQQPQQQQQQQNQPPPPPKSGDSSNSTSSTSRLVNKSKLNIKAQPFIPSSFRMQQQSQPVKPQMQDVSQQQQQQQQPYRQQQHQQQHQASHQRPQQQLHGPQQQQQQQMPSQQQQQQQVAQPQQQQPQQHYMHHQQQQQHLAYMQQQHYMHQQQQQMYAAQQQRQQQSAGGYKQQQHQQQPGPHAAHPVMHQHAPRQHQQQQHMSGVGPAQGAYSSSSNRTRVGDKDGYMRDRRGLQQFPSSMHQQHQQGTLGDVPYDAAAAVAAQQRPAADKQHQEPQALQTAVVEAKAALPSPVETAATAPSPIPATAPAGAAPLAEVVLDAQQQSPVEHAGAADASCNNIEQPAAAAAVEVTGQADGDSRLGIVDNRSSASGGSTIAQQEPAVAATSAQDNVASSQSTVEQQQPPADGAASVGPPKSSKSKQPMALPSSRSWSSVASAKQDAGNAAADAEAWPSASSATASAAMTASPKRVASGSKGSSTVSSTTSSSSASGSQPGVGSSSSGSTHQPQGSWRSGTGSLKHRLQRDGSSVQQQQQGSSAVVAAAPASAGQTAWPTLGGAAATADAAEAAGASPRAVAAGSAGGSWANAAAAAGKSQSSTGSSSSGAVAATPATAAGAHTSMARNSSSGSLKGQDAGAIVRGQQQQVARLGKQGSGGAYGGNSGNRLEQTPSRITINENEILFEGPREVWLQAQRLVRGLRNEGGAYNCFLNVIIQALWHLRSFRSRLLQLTAANTAAAAAAPIANGPSSKQGTAAGAKGQRVTTADVNVLQALRAVFQDLAQSPSLPADQQAQQQQQQQQQGPVSAAAARQNDSCSSQYLVSPKGLREALSGLELGAAAISIEMSEMHDASEVLNEIFTAVHRAEAGRATGIADDPHLPTKVKVKSDAFATRTKAQAAAAPQQPQQQPASQQPQQPVTMAQLLQNGVGNGPAMNGVGAVGKGNAAVASIQQKQPASLVHRLFGLDVLQAHAADALPVAAGSKSVVSKKGLAAAAGGKEAGQGQVEALQYMKFFHLMPAQALRAAYDRYFDTSFEVVLREAEAADHSSNGNSNGSGSWGSVGGKTAPSEQAGGLTPGGTCTALLRRPAVFTLAVVWESPKAPWDSIKGTVHALGPAVDLSQVFGGLPAGAQYHLRSVICYFGHHYQAFVLSEELQQWLLFDDHVIKLVGDWQQVQQTMINNRLQASLLFYEAADAAA